MGGIQLTYVGDSDLSGFVAQALNGSWIGFNCVDEDSLNGQNPGDVFITERTVRFIPNTPAVTDLSIIVQTVREKLGRSVPMIILVFNQVKSAMEVASLSGVRFVENKRNLPQVITELLQPTI